jgi:hypothetical protein
MTWHVIPLGVVAVVCGVGCSSTADSADTTSRSPAVTTAPGVSRAPTSVATSSPAPAFGAPTGGAVANSLWLAWSRDNRDGALDLATDEVVAALFARDPGDATAWSQPATCDEQGDLIVCAWETETDRLVIDVDDTVAVAARFESR